LDYLGPNVSEALKGSFGAAVVETLREARDSAARIVAANVDAILAFATTLDHAGELTGPELTVAIKAAGFQSPDRLTS
jgi:hypothetical protein